MSSPFHHLKVLDLSTVLAGPSVAMFFAELGARVTKYENPRTGGDVTRTWKLPSEDPASSVSAYYASVNFGKEVRQLDLSDPSSRGTLEAAIREADILLTNFKDGDEERFRLDTTSLRAINPRLIHGRITGFRSEPSRIAYDVVLQAETGFMFMNGTPESGPVKMPVALIDVLAAHHLKEGILAALYTREKSGMGATVTVSLEEAGMASLVNQASNFLMNHHVPRASGSLHPNIAPYGETFLCRDDRALVLAVGSDKQFAALCALLGEPEMASDARFARNQDRVIHRAELGEWMAPLFRKKDRDYWMDALVRSGIPAGAVRSMPEVMELSAAAAMVREETREGRSTRVLSSVAFQLDHWPSTGTNKV